MASLASGAAGGAGAGGDADLHSRLLAMAARADAKVGTATPLVLRVDGGLSENDAGCIWAYDICVQPLDASKGWLPDIGATPVKLRAIYRDQKAVGSYELPDRDDDTWNISTSGVLADIAKAGKELAAWQPGTCQGSCYDCGGRTCHCCGLEDEKRSFTILDGMLRGLQQKP